MNLSTLDLFKIGIGPSSSHTVGPMKAMSIFIRRLKENGIFDSTETIKVELYGSLSATGIGHGTDRAVTLGLLGMEAETIDTDKIPIWLSEINESKQILLGGERKICFAPKKDIVFRRGKKLPLHHNGLKVFAYGSDKRELLEKSYYSVGGGFVMDGNEFNTDKSADDSQIRVRHPFTKGAELLAICKKEGKSVSSIMLENEEFWRSPEETRKKLLEIWEVMKNCIECGFVREGILPGGLNVKRRAPGIYRRLQQKGHKKADIKEHHLEWLNLFAMAVNEENAAGSRIVTAPTNGAAGIIPAVLKYHTVMDKGASKESIVRFLLAAGAVGTLFKENASISGAEVGCQGEVGSACSMAAAGLAEVRGASPEQVENAAEIAMEHHLGLTCDPINGLVQVPCIERNAMASVHAVNSVHLSMLGTGEHIVSLDKVIRTMWQTGKDMSDKYKETSRGGLAVNIIEC